MTKSSPVRLGPNEKSLTKDHGSRFVVGWDIYRHKNALKARPMDGAHYKRVPTDLGRTQMRKRSLV